MNRYPLNAADVAGNREVFGDDATHGIAFNASGQVIVGAVLGGDSSLEIASSGSLIVGKVLAGETQVEVASEGEVIRGLRGESESEIDFASVGELYRGLLNEGAAEIAFYSDGDGVVAPPASATFTINFSSTVDATVVSPVYIEPDATNVELFSDLQEPEPVDFKIDFSSSADGISASTVFLDTQAMRVYTSSTVDGRRVTPKRSPASFPLRFNAKGQGNLQARGDSGTASIRVLSAGDARLGRKIYLEAMRSIIRVHGVAESLRWRQRYGEGTAQLHITMQESRYGKSTITAEFVAAPSERAFTVQADSRQFVVPRERNRA